MFNLSRVPPTVGDVSQKGNDYSQTRTLRPENGITDTNQNEWGVIAGHDTGFRPICITPILLLLQGIRHARKPDAVVGIVELLEPERRRGGVIV